MDHDDRFRRRAGISDTCTVARNYCFVEGIAHHHGRHAVQLNEFLHLRYVPARLLGGSPLTIEQYAHAVRALEKFAGKPLCLSEVTDDFLSEFAAFRLRTNSPADTDKILRHVATLLRWAVKVSMLARMPVVPFIKMVKRIPRAWTVEEVGRILEAAEQEHGSVGAAAAGDFWRAYVLVLFDTGLRLKSILTLPPSGFDRERRLIIAPPERIKDREELLCPISSDTAHAIDLLFPGQQREFLFDWPYDRYPGTTWTCFQKHFGRIIRRAGLTTEFKKSQRIRRTRASYGELACPGSATRDLGHSSRQVTTDSYLDPRIVSSARVVDLIPRPVAPAPVLRLFRG